MFVCLFVFQPEHSIFSSAFAGGWRLLVVSPSVVASLVDPFDFSSPSTLFAMAAAAAAAATAATGVVTAR